MSYFQSNAGTNVTTTAIPPNTVTYQNWPWQSSCNVAGCTCQTATPLEPLRTEPDWLHAALILLGGMAFAVGLRAGRALR